MLKCYVPIGLQKNSLELGKEHGSKLEVSKIIKLHVNLRITNNLAMSDCLTDPIILDGVLQCIFLEESKGNSEIKYKLAGYQAINNSRFLEELEIAKRIILSKKYL